MWLHFHQAVASAAAGSVATVDAAGDPVVTHMSVYFSLIASLLPHLALQHWQQQLLGQLQPQLLQVGCDGFCAGMSTVFCISRSAWKHACVLSRFSGILPAAAAAAVAEHVRECRTACRCLFPSD